MPDAMPARSHRHRTGQRVRRRGAGEADADADEGVAERDLPVGDVLLPQQQHGEEAEQHEDVAEQQRERARRWDSTSLAERGATRTMQARRRQDRRARFDGRVVQDVLQELLADEHRAHERAEHDDAGDGGDPERRPGRDVEVVERVRGPALADDERDRRPPTARIASAGDERALVRAPAAKLIARMSAADQRRPRGCRPGCRPASVPSFTCAGTSSDAMSERDGGERQR